MLWCYDQSPCIDFCIAVCSIVRDYLLFYHTTGEWHVFNLLKYIGEARQVLPEVINRNESRTLGLELHVLVEKTITVLELYLVSVCDRHT
jgi:hypothetical protein